MKEQILPSLPIVGKLKLTTNDGRTISQIEISRKKSSIKLDPFFNHCYLKLLAYLTKESRILNIPLDLTELTPFQKKVLLEIKNIPYGEVLSYKDLAIRIKTKGYQAVGSTCRKNPFLLVIPCHRVIGTGNLGGFAHGIRMKKNLLSIEAQKTQLLWQY